jgi:hypothetical protein
MCRCSPVLPCLAPALFVVSGIGCGSAEDSGTADLESPCAEETRGLDFTPGLEVDGDGLSVRLVVLSPDPPTAAATNSWTVEVTPAPSAPPGVSLYMPDHGHGAPDGAAALAADGTAELSLDFTMPGLWEVTVETDDGAVVMPVCAEP